VLLIDMEQGLRSMVHRPATGHQPGRPRIWTKRQLIDGIRWFRVPGRPIRLLAASCRGGPHLV